MKLNKVKELKESSSVKKKRGEANKEALSSKHNKNHLITQNMET